MFFCSEIRPNFGIDGSLLLLHTPYRFFVAQCWRHGIPLWNNLSGFGMPLLADPQSFTLSPLYALFYLFPTMYMWNQIIIIELAIGAICTYLLCLELEFGFIAAFSAALLFAFSPWIQWQSELLGPGICLTPFVFLFFARAAKKRSLWFTVLAGIAAAIDILASHPEMAFVSIAFATLLMFLIACRNSPSNFNSWKICRQIILAGLIAFGLSAPLLIPFKEFVANGYTYKLTEVAPANISWQALLANYLYPFHTEGNVFWGPLSWLGLAGLIFLPIKRLRFALCILICLPLSILATTKLFPLSVLFKIAPLSYVESLYCLPEYIAFIAILSGLGTSSLINYAKNIDWKKLAIFISLALAPAAISASLAFWRPADSHLRTDQASDFVQFNWKFWSINASCLAGMLIAWSLTRKRHLKIAGFIGLPVLAIGNLFFINHGSLPIRPSFDYPRTLQIKVCTENDSRFLTVGSRVFRHNTNLVYGLSNVQVYGPLLPNDFVDFMEACGAQTNDRFSQIFSPMISPSIDLTGTDTIISEQPLLDGSAAATQPGKGTITYTNQLTLSDIKLFRDSKAGFIFCSLLAQPYMAANENCSLFLDIKASDSTGYVLRDQQHIAGWRPHQAIVFSGFLPPGKKNWILSLRLLSDKDMHLIRPTRTTLGSIDSNGSWIIADKPGLFANIVNKRFQSVSNYQGIITYKNLSALNKYFLVNKITWVKDRQGALDFIKHYGSAARNVAVMEETQKKQFEDFLSKMQLSSTTFFDTSASIKKLSTSSASGLEIAVKNPALLVDSDLYYPGWKAFLDGKEWPVFRADRLFRAVIIPAGKHQILFEYRPFSFIIAATIFLITIATISVFFIKHHKQSSR